MNRDRWITFDCFGTLIDWLGGFRTILSPIAGARAGLLLAAYHEAERLLEADRPHYLYRHVLTAGLARAAQDACIDMLTEDADILVRRWSDLPLYTDVPAVLSDLREAGWKIGILTNCDDNLFAATLASNPALRPDMVVTAEEVRSYKPELGHFHRFKERSGVSRENWIHVANSWFHDIEPARRLGVKRIWMDRDRTAHDPAAATRVIYSLDDLPAALKLIV
jgi:2-haloacid dehalogenase